MFHATESLAERIRTNPKVSAAFVDEDSYKNLKPSEKKDIDDALNIACTGFINTGAYKSGDTSMQLYKTCCEMGGYCSMMKQTWFHILCIAVGLVFIHIISLLLIFLICRKKSKRASGGLDTDEKEVGNIGK